MTWNRLAIVGALVLGAVGADMLSGLALETSENEGVCYVRDFKLINIDRSRSRFRFVTVRGHGLIFSIVHLPPLTIDSPLTFTILVIFFTDTFRYIVW